MWSRIAIALLFVSGLALPARGQTPPTSREPPRPAAHRDPPRPGSRRPPPPRPRPQPSPPHPRTAGQRREAALETVVTARIRVEVPISDAAVRTEVIPRAALEARGAQTVGEALEDQPGVQVGTQFYYERGAPMGIQIAGCDARRVLVLRDGRRMVGETDGIVDAGTLILGDVARVELIRGATSTLYGADAICGVVNVISRDPPRHGVRLGWQAEYGRYDAHVLRFTLGARASPRLGVVYSGGMRGHRGVDLDPSTPGTDVDAQRALDGQLRVQWQPLDPLRINAVVGYLVDRRQRVLAETFPMMPGSQIFEAPWLIQRPEVALSAQWNFNRSDRVTARIYDHVYLSDARRSEVGGTTRRVRHTTHNYVNGSLFGRVQLGRWNIVTVGLEISHEYLDLTRRQSSTTMSGESAEVSVREVAGRSVHVEELFLQDELTPFPWLTVVPGLRYTHHAGFGHHATPKISVLMDPTPWLRIRLSYGQGFRAPTLKNLYLVFDHSELGVPLVIRGNPALEAETAHDLRLGLEVRPYRGALLYADGFDTEYRDLIEEGLPEFVDDHFEISRINVGRARIAGVQGGVRLPFLRDFRVTGSYLWLYARNLDTGERLQNRPEHRVRFGLQWRHVAWGTRLAFWGSWQDSVAVQSEVCASDVTRSPAYTLLNAYLEQRVWNGIRIYLRARNMTNTVRQGSNLCDLRPQPGWLLFGGVRGELSVH